MIFYKIILFKINSFISYLFIYKKEAFLIIIISFHY